MLRLAAVASLFLSLNLFAISSRTAAASAPASPNLARVYVLLKGAPLGTDRNLVVRDRFTRNHLRLDPTLPASRAYLQDLLKYQQNEIGYIRSQGVDLQVLYHFRVFANGFSALVPSSQLSHLRRLTNVALSLPVPVVRPTDERSISLVHAQQAWNNLGGGIDAGKGIYIADVDTGIDMSSACFSDKGIAVPSIPRRADTAANYALTNNKVPVIRAFGTYPGKSYSAVDVMGHGTFTAAVEACDLNTPTPLGVDISGMAPAAHLMVYNVNPGTDTGDGPQDPFIAAFDAAALDGADVVNYSYGDIQGAGAQRFDLDAQYIDNATKAGLTFVVSAGNAGPTPQSISSPSTAVNAISVGASTNNRSVSEEVMVQSPAGVPDALQHIRAVEGSHAFTNRVGPLQVVPVGLGARSGDDPNNFNEDDFSGKDLHGKVALIQRGDLKFETKINNAAQAGAVAAIVWDNHFELSPPGMDVGTATIPAMAISQADGQALLAWVTQHPDATLVMDPTKHAVDETPNILSDFSSRGYGPDYRIKPDLVAPGQDIYSAVETDKPGGELYDASGFAAADGTSFSAPHVTGAVALILQKHPTWTPAQVKGVLMETASTTALSVPGESTPRVQEVGAGLLDVQAALAAGAEISPSSISTGEVNVGYGGQQQNVTLTLSDLGGGSGTWSGTVQPLHSNSAISIGISSSAAVSSGGHADTTLHLSESASTPPGDYDGYVVFTNGDQTLHIPYFIHVASKAVTAGSVLLVDASTTLFQPAAPKPAIKHLDVSKWFETALSAIGRPYTYWDDAVQGAPSLADMQRASAVVYFTGNDLNDFDSGNDNVEALQGPLNSVNVDALVDYLQGGGKLFISGLTAALSDSYFSAFLLGAEVSGLSEFDNARNDQANKGGISPPQPSAVVDKRNFIHRNQLLFAGLKPIDLSTKGDGAGDNLAIVSTTTASTFRSGEKFVGVTDLNPFDQSDPSVGAAGFGQAVLRNANLTITDGNGDIAMANADDPGFGHVPKYKGRSILFTFDFAGINDNTGYATRAQVLKRVFQWLDDKPTAAVSGRTVAAGRPVTLAASLKDNAGAHAATYAWQIGSQKLKATSKATTRYTFPHAGTFKARVMITDTLGHTAVSSWASVTAR